MEGGIAADAPLAFVAFRISPSQDRYEASVSDGNTEETLTEGVLGELPQYLPNLSNLGSENSNATIKLQLPEDVSGAAWFTKTTVKRFLDVASSSDLLSNINAVKEEMSQLEKARNFHLSLYSQNHQPRSEKGKTGGYHSSSKASAVKPHVVTMSSDASKNELLRAMDLRLSALKEELVASFIQASGSKCCPEDILNLVKFSQQFEATELEQLLRLVIELSPKKHIVNPSTEEKHRFSEESRSNHQCSTGGITNTFKQDSIIPVKYGVSPAKVAQVERQSSSESEESSDSVEQISAERSRSRIRSASPRRSASPMRRVQIARVGSRRTTALTIKSLSSFPARDKGFVHKDAAGSNSEEDESDKLLRKPETNMLRMSVQDAISLFERKQIDQIADKNTKGSSTDASSDTSRCVLRRWSAGMGNSSSRSTLEAGSEDCKSQNVKKSEDMRDPEVEVRKAPESVRGGHDVDGSSDVVVTSKTCNDKASLPTETQRDTLLTKSDELTEPLTDAAKWNQQKEEEMKMLIQMMENRPAKRRTPPNSNTREQSGTCYDHYKEKRDEKLQSQNAGKRAEKEAHLKELQQIIDKSKADMASKNSNIVVKRNTLQKTPQPSKRTKPTVNVKKESTKTSIVRKETSKVSPLPTVRKSWPSQAPSRLTGTSPARVSSRVSPANAVPTSQKYQTSLLNRSGLKAERAQQPKKDIKKPQADSNPSSKVRNMVQHNSVPKVGKITKAKGLAASEYSSNVVPKTNLNSRVTKKGSVVPQETKPFHRKGSKFGHSGGPTATKTKVSAQPEESMRDCENLLQPKTEMNQNISVPVDEQGDNLSALENNDTTLPSDVQMTSHQNSSSIEGPDNITANGNDDHGKRDHASVTLETEEERVISPSAWIEREEHERHDLPVSHDHRTSQLASPAAVRPAEHSSPRVRHSLSQMLQEESNELDIVEWGNAENPPSVAFPKDSSKGFKRLLKFARKNKGDANITGWSSPLTMSEGEEDTEESKSFHKRNLDTRLRKATSHAKNSLQQKSFMSEGSERRDAANEGISAHKLDSLDSYKSLEHKSRVVPTTKASRSFFSLSALRGSK